MPVEALQPSRRQILIRNGIAASPPRLRPKGPVGPDFFRQSPTAAAAKPKQSAVERLEADKAKYVKSQVALSKQQQQQQIRAPIARKPPLNPSTPLRPTRKTQPQSNAKPEGVQLDLKHLSNLISIGNDGPQPTAAECSQDRGVLEGSSTTITAHDQTTVETQKKAERPCPPPRPDWASPAKVRLKSTAPTRGDTSGPSGTVRRVDVMPQTNPVRTTCRPPLFLRQPLHPLLLHSKPPIRLAMSNLHFCDPRAPAGSTPLKPAVAPLKPSNPPTTTGSPVPPLSPPTFAAFPPSSPAITRLSSSSSRKRPSLTRSKSDVSDRFSRAGTDLERFFNLCGLDPADLSGLAGSSSDVVSLARFRSISAPGSECAGSDRDEEEENEEEEDAVKAADRAPYGVSVIERNARVIKWLYGLRQAKDASTKTPDP